MSQSIIEIINNSAEKSRPQAELLITAMVAYEYQFEVTTRSKKRALVAFSKGIHRVWIEGDLEMVYIDDSGFVEDPDWLGDYAMEAFLEGEKKSWVKDFDDGYRNKVAQAIYRYLNQRLGLADEYLIKLIVHQPGRNGFVEGGEMILARKDW